MLNAKTMSIQQELDTLVVQLEKDLNVLSASAWEFPKKFGKSPKQPGRKSQLDVLEIYCGENSRITAMAQQMGLKARRFTKADGDLRTAEGQRVLWELLERECPRDVWMAPECGPWGNFSRLNLCRSSTTCQKVLDDREEQRLHLKLCDEVYNYQVLNGNHFHMEQPQGSIAFDQPEMENVAKGTLKSVFDMCEVGKLKVPLGNNFLRKRTQVRTTSRELHNCLDARYCNQRHTHQPIEGKIKYLGRWINLSEYAARYSNGFARNVVWYLLWSRDFGDLPVEIAELCIDDCQKFGEHAVLAAEVSARRRRLSKEEVKVSSPAVQSEDGSRKLSWEKRWKEIFKSIEQRAPRAGTVVLDPAEKLFQDIKSTLTTIDVKAAEVCRGTDRFRLPKTQISESEIPLRHTIILHRHTGKVMELGKPESWLELPKTRRTLKSKPAKLCVTVFGDVWESSSRSAAAVPSEKPPTASMAGSQVTSSSGSRKREVSDSDMDVEKRFKKDEPSVSTFTEKGLEGKEVGEYSEGFPPKKVAVHGPHFLGLEKDEREWIRRVHHRMGHPDPVRFCKFLKDTHADPKIVAGAFDFQCDACCEDSKGYALSRPAAIHSNLNFNDVVGLDVAYWKNDVGKEFAFLHFLDEGTLFHLGSHCFEDADSQVRCFETVWLSWAGPPKEVYLDPAKEYTGDRWIAKMQEEDIKLKMSATDSHWQLGRVEAHGSVVKRMLDRMNSEKPILDNECFQAALRQVFNAKNAMSRVQGFTPEQAVLGVARRLPASVCSDRDIASHALAESECTEGEKFREALRLRTSARQAFVEADNCSSLRRALLRRSRPLRDPYEIGDWVLYWKRKGGNMRRERGRWHGPARVAMVEGHKVVWVTHANKLIRASPEQLRPASFREWKSVQDLDENKVTPAEWLKKAGHQDFFDLGDDLPDLSDVVEEGPLCGDNTESDSLPEPEQAPSVHSGDVEAVPSSETGGLHVPVPEPLEGELSEGDALFGDCIDCPSGLGNQVWEIDITPGSEFGNSGNLEWDVFSHTTCTWDEVALLATEQRKKRVEVKLKDLGEHDQRLFAAAKDKEIRAWLHHKTVRKVSKGRIPENALMRCRWILIWKPASGNENPGELSSQGLKAKARLIIIGFEDPGIDVVTNDAPTLTKDGRMTVLQNVASHGWELLSFDISTAFLHGKGDGRTLGIHAPPELKEALQMSGTDQCALDGGAYGRIDAPYLWFCECRDELIRQGCMQCPLDPWSSVCTQSFQVEVSWLFGHPRR